MNPIRTLLVDDSPGFLDVTLHFLWRDKRFEVVGCCLSGASALEQVADLRPSLVLMDLAMPGMNGLEATCRIKKSANPPRIVMLTLFDNSEYREAAKQAGADAFVAKHDLHTDLVPVVLSMFPEKITPDG